MDNNSFKSTKGFTNERLLELLRDYYSKYGYPRSRDCNSKNGLATTSTYRVRFGSFENALKLAGIEIPKEREKDFGRAMLSDEDLLVGLKRLVDELLQTQLTLPSTDQIALCSYTQSDGTYAIRFGSIDVAYSLIGYNREEFNNKRIEEDMLKKYMEIYEILGRTPNSRDIDKFSKDNPYYYSTGAYIHHFGNVMDLQALCNLPLTKASQRKTKEDLLNDLIELSKELGRTPYQMDIINCPYMATPPKYMREFGSFSQALVEAGLEPNNKVRITKLGNKCLSYLEYKFTRVMEINNIPFEKEIYYKTVIPNFERQYRFDYLINIDGKEYYIEIFGITANKKYDVRKAEKIQLCKDHNVPLITFEFGDFWSNTNDEVYQLLLSKIDDIDIKI